MVLTPFPRLFRFLPCPHPQSVVEFDWRKGVKQMADNELLKIKQIKETEDVDEANTYLARGWILISTYTYMPYRGEHGNLNQVYSLGWPFDLEELAYLQDEKGKEDESCC